MEYTLCKSNYNIYAIFFFYKYVKLCINAELLKEIIEVNAGRERPAQPDLIPQC